MTASSYRPGSLTTWKLKMRSCGNEIMTLAATVGAWNPCDKIALHLLPSSSELAGQILAATLAHEYSYAQRGFVEFEALWLESRPFYSFKGPFVYPIQQGYLEKQD